DALPIYRFHRPDALRHDRRRGAHPRRRRTRFAQPRRDQLRHGGSGHRTVRLLHRGGRRPLGPTLCSARRRPPQLPGSGVHGLGGLQPLPDIVVFIAAFAIGATSPQVAPLSRSRLVDIILTALPPSRRPKVLNATMAYESAADEVIFVFGPFLVGLLATFFNPVAPIIGAIVMTIVFVSGLALHPTGRARAAGGAAELDERAPAKDMFTGGVFVVVLGVFGVGMVFGSTLTALTALTNDIGRPEEAGLIYGVMGIGSAVM